MAMQADPSMTRDMPAGQRLYCAKCEAEIEIIQPCTCNPPDQVFQCCGQPMEPSPGMDVHLGTE